MINNGILKQINSKFSKPNLQGEKSCTSAFSELLNKEENCNFNVSFLDDENLKLNVKVIKSSAFVTKNGEAVNYMFEAHAMNQNCSELGEIYFSVDNISHKLHLGLIKTLPKYFNKGISSKLLSFAEFVGAQLKVDEINGFFMPQDDRILQETSFYFNNGYTINNQKFLNKRLNNLALNPNILVELSSTKTTQVETMAIDA